MLLVSVGGAICSVGASYFAAKVSAGMGRALRGEVFAHVENFSLNEFDKISTSSLITRTTNDITQVQQLVNMMLRMMVMAPLTAIGGIIMALYTNLRLSVIIVIVVPLLGLSIYAVMKRGISLFRVLQVKIDKLNQVIRENLAGIRVIRSFDRTEFEWRRFDQANADLTDTARRAGEIMALLMPLMMVVMNAATLAILWFGGGLIGQGDLQIGSLMAFLQYALQILFAVMMVSFMLFLIPRAQASANRINEVLELHPGILEKEAAQPVTAGNRQVDFRDVTFSYPGAETPALSHITFTARTGEVTAIIGGTGAGKSTLLNLLLRFYEVDSGSVLVDGIDIREWPLSVLRAKIGYVPQKAVLFSGSVAENIRYGKLGAEEEEVSHAAETAQAAAFIAELDGGLAAIIDRGGVNISGGQKQRMAIARALVRQPDIYLFDDSFSALDYKTDAKLRKALQKEIKDKVVLIVAQRVSTVMTADQIIVLEDGVVQGIGTHADLLASSAVYREIVASQFAEGVGV